NDYAVYGGDVIEALRLGDCSVTYGSQRGVRAHWVIVLIVAIRTTVGSEERRDGLRAVAGWQHAGSLFEAGVRHHGALGDVTVVAGQAHGDTGDLTLRRGGRHCQNASRSVIRIVRESKGSAVDRTEILTPEYFVANDAADRNRLVGAGSGVPLHDAAVTTGSAVRSVATDAT